MAPKRKIGLNGLQRRVRPRREDDWERDSEDGQASSSGDDEVEEQSTRRHKLDDNDDDEDDDSEEEQGDHNPNDESDEDDEDQNDHAPKVDLSSVSFGALAKAQATLPPSKRGSKFKPETTATDHNRQPLSAHKSSTSRSKDDPKPKRTSKHAPQEQSSKRPVSRRREFLPEANPRRQYRDPRFDPLVGRVDEEKAKKNYAFLDEYRDKELADLRAQVKKTKNLDEKEALKRQVLSMESKKKSRLRKEEAQNLIKEHRKREKDLVAQGKTPFYLKKSEQKKQLLMDRYAGMSKGQVDRAIERKRKKVAGKEKKELDFLQRRPRD